MTPPWAGTGRLHAAMIGAVCAVCALPAWAAPRTTAAGARLPAIAAATVETSSALQPISRSGREIYAAFRDGLSSQACAADASERWLRQYSHVPKDLADRPERLLPLFGYVVDALREYHLPTEYALIPFIESGYRPGARSPAGPAGLWQFITATARNHKISIRPGYDGRLSPLESTTAAVRYLRTLHGMFAGDWRLAVMGYNAGEYRIFGALRNAGQQAMTARPDALAVPAITHAYVRKLQALSCLLVESGESKEWLDAIDQTVPVLTAVPLPPHVRHLDRWAGRNGHDPALVRHFNPVFPDGRVAGGDRNLQVLVPARPEHALAAFRARANPLPTAGGEGPARPADDEAAVYLADASDLVEDSGSAGTTKAAANAAPRTHTVIRGESAWRIARRYGMNAARLLLHNGLDGNSVLQPGMVLRIDAPGTGESPHVAN